MKVFVTGGTGGIGEALVRHLYQKGHQICFSYCSRLEEARQLENLSGDRRLMAVQMDLKNSDSVEYAADQAQSFLDGIDLVVNNAAVNLPKLMIQQSDEDWAEIMETNLTGSFYLCRAFLMPFLGQGYGRFIHMGSISASGLAGQAAYSAAKAGLEGLSASIAREYGSKGIRSNILRLGLADIGMGESLASEEMIEKWTENCPAGRLMEMRDVYSAVDFLADSGSDFINGTVIPVTGGMEQI